MDVALLFDEQGRLYKTIRVETAGGIASTKHSSNEAATSTSPSSSNRAATTSQPAAPQQGSPDF